MSKNNNERGNNPLPMLFFSVCMLAIFALAAFAHMRISDLDDAQQALGSNSDKGLEIKSQKDLDRMIKEGITAYVEDERQKRIQDKYVAYDLAEAELDKGRHIYGLTSARFTLVEFSDLECGYCKKFHSTAKKLVDNSKGKVNWQWKHMPLGFHNPAATVAAEASECVADVAGNKAFWVFVEQFFDQTKGNGSGVKDIASLVQNIGVDTGDYNACMSEGRFKMQVAADASRGAELGVTGTPSSFIVDNKTGNSVMIDGARPIESYISVINRMSADETDIEKDLAQN